MHVVPHEQLSSDGEQWPVSVHFAVLGPASLDEEDGGVAVLVEAGTTAVTQSWTSTRGTEWMGVHLGGSALHDATSVSSAAHSDLLQKHAVVDVLQHRPPSGGVQVGVSV